MGTVWKTPSHRNIDHPQIEFCALCGQPESAQDMVLATAEGLAGQYICANRHGSLGFEPSYQDLGGPGNAFPAKEPLLPHSGANGLFDDEQEFP